MIYKLSIFFVFLFFPLLPAQAQSNQTTLEIEEHITGLDIEEHFNMIEELYTGERPDMVKIGAFVEQYPLDDFILTETVIQNRGTQEPETAQKDKTAFIEKQNKREYELLDTRIRHTLTNIKYLDDKISAEVSYTSLFQGKYMKNLKDRGLSIIGFKSLSICTDILKLVNGKIRGLSANCKVEVIYDEPKPAN